MVEKINAQQAYLNQFIKKLPNVERGKCYEVKSNDNLWKIAKKQLAQQHSKVSTPQVENYVYQIAKLNNLTTIDKMNKLKVSDKIYLPKEQTQEAKNRKETKSLPNKTTKKTFQKTTSTNKKRKILKNYQTLNLKRTSAEKSILTLTNIINNDKTVFVEKVYKGYPSPIDLYHVYNNYNKTGYRTPLHGLLSFRKNNKTGKIISVEFNDTKEDKNPIAYDYKMDNKGNIFTNKNYNEQKRGNVNKTEIKNLFNILNKKTRQK